MCIRSANQFPPFYCKYNFPSLLHPYSSTPQPGPLTPSPLFFHSTTWPPHSFTLILPLHNLAPSLLHPYSSTPQPGPLTPSPLFFHSTTWPPHSFTLILPLHNLAPSLHPYSSTPQPGPLTPSPLFFHSTTWQFYSMKTYTEEGSHQWCSELSPMPSQSLCDDF